MGFGSGDVLTAKAHGQAMLRNLRGLMFKLFYFLKNLAGNISRLVEYAPLVWSHRNWDHGYVLRFNKKLYEDLYRGCYVDGHHVFSWKDARRLRTVIALLDRLDKDSYDDFVDSVLDKKYGPDEFSFEEIPETKDAPGGPYSRMVSSRFDRLGPDKRKVYFTDRKALLQQADKMCQQDLNMLGRYIARYGKKWWD